jgi:hypothetical protein
MRSILLFSGPGGRSEEFASRLGEKIRDAGAAMSFLPLTLFGTPP